MGTDGMKWPGAGGHRRVLRPSGRFAVAAGYVSAGDKAAAAAEEI